MESLPKKNKKENFATLDLNSVSDNKNFGRSFNLRFLNNVKAKTTTKLVEKKKTKSEAGLALLKHPRWSNFR